MILLSSIGNRIIQYKSHSSNRSDERLSDYESSLRNIFTGTMKIDLSDLNGRKNIKIKPSKLCILCTQVHNMRWLSNPASTVFMGYILKNDHPEYNSLLEGFAPLRPRLKNERKSDIMDIENGRILRFWRSVYERKTRRGTEVKGAESPLE